MLRRFSKLNIFIYRVSGGKLMGKRNGLPLLLLTTVGRKSGQKHTVPLTYLRMDDHFVLMPGVYERPDWYLNLKSDAQAVVQVGRDRFEVLATEAVSDERSRLWALVPQYWRDYQARFSEPLPIIRLQRSHEP
jgi:deazaflavin-dependent oxidoreductase (nitroreductase family)